MRDGFTKNIAVVHPAIASGEPVFRGTRVTVKMLFDYLDESSMEESLKGFPSATRQQAEAVIGLKDVK